MAFRSGEVSNPNGNNGRPWKAAIGRALARAEADGDYRSLNSLADKLLEMAAKGDIAALKELGDRLDGRPVQGVELGGPGGEALVVRLDPVDGRL